MNTTGNEKCMMRGGQRRSMRTSISMPAHMFTKAIEKQQKHGYPTFSDYIQSLVRKDALMEAVS